MNSLKHSFKTHTHKAKEEGEKQPILQVNHLENYNTQYSMATASSTAAAAAAAVDSSNKRKEVVVKINGEGDNNNNNLAGGGGGGGNKNPMQREVSYEFWKEDGSKGGSDTGNDGGGGGSDKVDDPPSKLIGQFLNKQSASGEICLDMDLEMEELRNDRITPIPEEPKAEEEEKEPNFSFQGPSPKTVAESVLRRRSSGIDKQSRDSTSMGRGDDGGGGIGGGGEALKRTPTLRKNKSFLRCKTKSRLIDTEKVDRRSGRVARSGQLKSGYLGRMNDEEEEDPFADGDLPDEYRKAKFSTLTIIQWVSLILIIGALVCSLTIHRFKKKLLWDLPIWKWLLFCFVLLCGRLVSGWIIRFCVFFIERSFILRKRVLYFVYGVRKAVQNCLWLGLVLIAWHYLFDKKVTVEVKGKTLPYVVTKVLICFLVGTLLWLVKTLLVKVLASSFHVSTYFDRIQDSLFNQYVIETLSGPPLLEMQNIQEEQEKTMVEIEKLQNAGATMPFDLKATALSPMKNGTVIGSGVLQNSPRVVKSFRVSGALAKKQEEGITIEQLHKLNQKNISAWNMKRLMAIVRHGVLSTLDDHIQEAANEDDSANEIRSECEAKYAARKIFNNVSKPHSKFIYLDDLLRFMADDEASRTMNLFEGSSESKRVSKKALKNWVVIFLSCILILDYVRSWIRCQMNSNKEIFRDKDPYHINVFRERRALALTLDDTKTAVNQLHRMVNAVVAIVLLVICLLILGIATTQLLVFISSQLLLVAFMFGNTCKMVFESIIFLFVIHPFDVGDRCEIDGVQMVVEEMNILTTVFLKFDNHKIVYPNIILSTKPISNYYRSPDMGDAIDFCVHIATSAEKIALMKQRLIGYIENKTEHWYPGPMVVLRDVEDMNRLKISIWLQHRINHQDMGERWARRALLVEEMIKILRDLDIEYRMLPLDINVRNMPPLSSTRVPSLWSTCNN